MTRRTYGKIGDCEQSIVWFAEFKSSEGNSATTLKLVWGNCLVCGDRGTGKHYGIVACEGCKGFFKRSVRKSLNYSCQGNAACLVDKVHRNRCQKCRLDKCLTMGMKKEAVQCERKPITKVKENSTNDNHLRHASLSPDTASVYPVYQEKLDSLPQILTNTASFTLTPTNLHVSQTALSAFFSGGRYNDIISSEHLQFKLKPPTLGVSTLSMDYVYEIATRLLFLTVDWARSIQAFRGLECTDQLVLLQSTWSDLFMLGVAQCSSSFPLSPLLKLAAAHAESNESNLDHSCTPTKKEPNVVDKIMSVKELLFSLEKLELDFVEYAFLKAVVLFNSDCSSLRNPKQVERLQEKAHCSLKQYVENKYPNSPERFAKILLRLPATRMLTQRAAEELFFSPLIGAVRIESIMNNIISNSLTF